MNLASQASIFKMRSKIKAKCSFASVQIKSYPPAQWQPFTGTMYSWGSSFQAPNRTREVHHGARCPLLQQEFPFWASLQLDPSCQPELSGSRSHCLKENSSSSAPCCSGGSGCCQGPASVLNAAVLSEDGSTKGFLFSHLQSSSFH